MLRGVDAQAKFDAQRFHELDAAADDRLVEFHVGDAVHEQPSRAVIALDDRDTRPAPRKVPCARKAGGARPDHRHARSVPARPREPGGSPVFPFPIGERALVIVNRHGLPVDGSEVACGLAQSRAHATGKLGQGDVIERRAAAASHAPAVDEFVPLGNEVVERAARSCGRAQTRCPIGKTPRRTSCSGSLGHVWSPYPARYRAGRNPVRAGRRGAARAPPCPW